MRMDGPVRADAALRAGFHNDIRIENGAVAPFDVRGRVLEFASPRSLIEVRIVRAAGPDLVAPLLVNISSVVCFAGGER